MGSQTIEFPFRLQNGKLRLASESALQLPGSRRRRRRRKTVDCGYLNGSGCVA